MHRFDDLRYDRIAHRLGISEKAVEREMAKALRAIARLGKITRASNASSHLAEPARCPSIVPKWRTKTGRYKHYRFAMPL
jgi:hypothetical protein